MNLFDFLYRGATVYVAAGQIYAEAESNASLLAIASGATVYAGRKGRIAQKPGAMQVCLQLPQARQHMRPRYPLR